RGSIPLGSTTSLIVASFKPPHTNLSTDARALLERPLRRRPKVCIADAIVEADPVDAEPLAGGIAVAEVKPPARRLVLLHIFESALHRLLLLGDALLLPLAAETDVQ